MKKQVALLVSTLVLLSAVSVQPAHAFKLFHKKAKPAVVAPVKKEVAPVKEPAKVAPAAKPAAVAPVKPVVKTAPVAPAKSVAKPVAKAPVKK